MSEAEPKKSSKTKTKTISFQVTEDGATPRIVIIGRGTLTGTITTNANGEQTPSRKLEALRIRTRTMDRVRALVAGPAYLAVDLLLQRACDVLEKEDKIEAIRAEDMES